MNGTAARRPDRSDAARPLVVDADRALTGGDLLVEGIARMAVAAPRALLASLSRLADGRAALKRRVAEAAPLSPATLVLNPAVLDEIDAARAAGREVWLTSAADERAAAPLAETVGAAGCLAIGGHAGPAGSARAAALVERFGEGGFDYVGGARRDLAVWRRAGRAIGVGLPPRLARRLRTLDGEARLLPGLGRPRAPLQALRPHQWVKNLLVFAPLGAAHETGLEAWLAAVGLFAALSACASGGYLLNDLLDLPHDRRHPGKRRRPLAAGAMPLPQAAGLAAALPAGGIAAAFLLSAEAGLCLLFYLILTVAYSLWLKRKLFADVVALALLYTLRVVAGAAAASVALSHWFLAFSIFVFLALAIVKRQKELRSARESDRSAPGGRAYFAGDLPVMAALGAAAGFAAAVVLALYVQSLEVSGRYDRPELLWAICLLLVYWLGRMTLLADRGALDDDPLVFAMRDRASRLTALGVLVAFTAAL